MIITINQKRQQRQTFDILLTVCPREEAEGTIVARNQVARQYGPEANDVGDDVAVGEHHSLRLARSAGGVDQRRELLGVGQIGGHILAYVFIYLSNINHRCNGGRQAVSTRVAAYGVTNFTITKKKRYDIVNKKPEHQ